MKFLLFFFLISLNVIPQSSDSIPHSEIKIFNSKAKDFIFSNGIIYYLTAGDSLVIYQIKDKKVQSVIKNVQAFTVDKQGSLLYASSNDIYKQSAKSFKKFAKTKHAVFNLFTDDKGKILAKTAGGIYYKGKDYPFPDNIIKKIRFVYRNANVCFVDSKNRFWIAYDRGEWGGELIIFDLREKTFKQAESLHGLYFDKYYDMDEEKVFRAKDKDYFEEFKHLATIDTDTLYKFPYELPSGNIKSVAEDAKGRFLITRSMMNFYFDGSLNLISPGKNSEFYKIEEWSNVLEYSYKEDEGYKFKFLEEYVGPSTYNTFDNTFYYYTNNGFYKIIENPDSSVKKEFIVRPRATWTSGMAHSVGYQMNVSKFQFINEKEFLFLTLNNGIGHYTGSRIIYYK